MPTYQYACTECNHAFEQFQGFHEDALTVCPQCEGRLRKVFNAVGVVFKGSGFYRNDSRTDGRTKTPAGASAETSAATKDGAASTKPDAGSGSGNGSTSPSTTSTPASTGGSGGQKGSSAA
ncbi:MAG: FmdB family zinc ribbon protein [Nocardioidaceae bacterium]